MEFTGERFIPDCGLEAEIELEHLQRYLSVQNVVSGKKVLDVASGAGYGSALMAESAAYVCGVDIDLEAVAYSRKHYQRRNLKYLRGSLAALPFASGSFDVVISFETIEHVTEDLHAQFLEEIGRVLAPNGFLIISSPDKHIYSEQADYKNEFHLKEYYRKEFYDFLKRSFTNVRLLDQFQGLAYVMSDSRADSCRVLHREPSLFNGKYLVAVCGQNELPASEELGSVIFDREGIYQKKIDRIVELQGEIVEKNQNIADNWKMIHERDAIIDKNWKEISERNVSVEKMNQELAIKEDLVDAFRESEMAKEATIAGLQKELGEMQRQVSDLSNSLAHIQATKAWKIIQKLYWLKDKIRSV